MENLSWCDFSLEYIYHQRHCTGALAAYQQIDRTYGRYAILACHMEEPKSPLEHPRHKVEGTQAFHDRLHKFHEFRMRRVLLEVEVSVFFFLKFNNPTIRIRSLLFPVLAYYGHRIDAKMGCEKIF